MVNIEGPIESSGELREHVIARIESGAWAAGERLPSVRRLADRLGLAPNTVAKAYRELEAAGWVHTAGRHGTVVAAPESKDVDAEARALASAYVKGMRGLGLDRTAILAYTNRGLDT